MTQNNQKQTRNEVGFVTSAKHYLLSIEGLPSARVNEIIVNQKGAKAIVQALKGDKVIALALDPVLARPGDRYTFPEGQHMYYCGEELFGRIITTMGDPADGGSSLPSGNVPFAVEVDAPGIENRVHIQEQMQTGISLVDTLVPLAKGQRQLVFGPMSSGITTFLTEVVLNQRAEGVVCIYVAIGKPLSDLREITDIVLGEQGNQKTVVISALSDEPSPVIALAPSVAYLIADYFRSQGEDVLIVLDDLDAHAKYLREIALLEGRLPSTESYPGDIFYQHAHLMERSGHFGEKLGGGSITTLPVIKTSLKSFSDLIPTNLMGCTDGHFAFLPELYAEGTYPPISFEQSVTRVGRHTQRLLQKQLTSRIQVLLSRYKQQREYSQFSAKVSDEAKKTLHQGKIIEELLRQKPYRGIPIDVQVPLLSLGFTSFLLGKEVDFVLANKDKIIRGLIEDDRLRSLRESVGIGTDGPDNYITIDEFILSLEDLTGVFESICQA